ncbi:MAG: ABC transporter [Deltaproteobacteria bacterium]|nr:MAG: ABC transporter [Deltaproteobacteria bacterium]
MDIRTLLQIRRFKDILFTLFKYGLDDVVDRLDLPGRELFAKIHPDVDKMSTWERIRHTLEDLGPTFVKFGQLLSLRPDLLPTELIEELEKLQDDVPLVSFAEIKQRVEQELGAPLEEIFFRFDEKPIAAGSLAQVHRAILMENREVVAVKVQRPGIRSIVDKDLAILEAIVRRLERRTDRLKIWDLPNLVKELRRGLTRELDFTREARNMKIARSNLVSIPTMRIPRVFDSYTTSNVLTMELMMGKKLKEIGIEEVSDRQRLAKALLESTLIQILDHGFFHADPHPGNIMLLDGQVMCLIDWGMVGRLSTEARYALLDLVQSIVGKDTEKILWILAQFADMGTAANPRMIQREIMDILDSFHGVPLSQINIGRLLLDVINVLREHHIRLPADMAIMAKAIVTAEGTARRLYPDLNVVKEAEPHVQRLAKKRWQPDAIFSGLKKGLYRLLYLQKNLPGRIEHIVEVIDKGELKFRFQHENLSGLRKTLETISNRLTSGIIIAALIIGSSMIITTGVKPLLFGFPVLGVIGYLVSALLGLWLVFTIIRKKKW